MCTTKDVGELFINKSDELVLAFDKIMTLVMSWKPNDMGASIHSVVFTNKKAWLIIKPMKSTLDVKFYYQERIDSQVIKKYTAYPNKLAHHIRIASEDEVTREVVELLRNGYDYAMQ